MFANVLWLIANCRDRPYFSPPARPLLLFSLHFPRHRESPFSSTLIRFRRFLSFGSISRVVRGKKTTFSSRHDPKERKRRTKKTWNGNDLERGTSSPLLPSSLEREERTHEEGKKTDKGWIERRGYTRTWNCRTRMKCRGRPQTRIISSRLRPELTRSDKEEVPASSCQSNLRQSNRSRSTCTSFEIGLICTPPSSFHY